MAFEMIVGLNVVDREAYAEYRKGITPILKEYGGGFRYDFSIKETFSNSSPHPITRLFAIYFPDKATKEKFFADDSYRTIRAQYMEKAVDGRVTIAEHIR